MSNLDDWAREIEALDQSRVTVVDVLTDPEQNTLRIPPDFPGRPIVVRFLSTEDNVRQLLAAHALTLHWSGNEGSFHLVLMNMARAAEWEGQRDLVLAHEYGHTWLQALGYRTPAYSDSCLAIHTGDVVQHEMIRDETARRGLDYRIWWRRVQERWLETERTAAATDACGRMQMASLYLDATLGFTESSWDKRNGYLKRIREWYPEAAEAGEALAREVGGHELWDRSIYAVVLRRAGRILARL